MTDDSPERILSVLSAKNDLDGLSAEHKAELRDEWTAFLSKLSKLKGMQLTYIFTVMYKDDDKDAISGQTLVGGSPISLMFLESALHHDMAEKFQSSGVCTCENCYSNAAVALTEKYAAKSVESKNVVPGSRTQH